MLSGVPTSEVAMVMARLTTMMNTLAPHRRCRLGPHVVESCVGYV